MTAMSFVQCHSAAGLVLKAGCHTMALGHRRQWHAGFYVANYGENSILRGGGTFFGPHINGKPRSQAGKAND